MITLSEEQFKDRLKKLRLKKGLTSEGLANALDIPHSSLRRMESQNDIPRPKRLNEIANFFNVTTDYLLGREQNSHQYVKEDAAKYGITPYEPDTMIRIPILGSIRAGEPLTMIENIEGYEYIEPSILRGREGFVLKVKGDSMTGDRIFEGDLVVCVKQDESEPHEISVVSVDSEEATLKRVKCVDGMCVLSSSNPAKEPMIYPAKKIKILGVAIRVLHDL